MMKPNTKFISITFVTLVASVITAIACGWNMFSDHSVRFSVRSGREFYRLPPLPIMYNPATGKETTVFELNDYGDYGNYDNSSSENDPVAKQPDPDEIWNEIGAGIETMDFEKVQTQASSYLQVSEYPGPSERQERRNSANDILDALSALNNGSKPESVRSYLKARYYLDFSANDNSEIVRPETTPDQQLIDNWAYLNGAVLLKADKKDEALSAFEAHAAKYPKSEKNSTVLYMIAKLTMEKSYSFTASGCGIEGKTTWGEDIDAKQTELAERCRDNHRTEAITKFQSLMKKFPNGRYFDDSRGWVAFLYKRGGERAKALAEYYRLLGHPTSRKWRLEAKKSLQIIGHEYGDRTLDEVEKLIKNEPDAALAYAYHRIYNHAVDLTYRDGASWPYYKPDESNVKDAVAKDNSAGNHELRRIASFATQAMARYPKRVSGAFTLRVAQAQLELQNFPEALNLSQKAINLGVGSNERAEALWVKGSSEHALKNLVLARKTFLQLVADFPDSKLTEGARRLLAITAEDQDDLEFALDQYFALKYEYDIAYFVDVLMPTERLAKYVNTRESHEKYNELLYALGVRYMRDDRWAEARETLRKVRTKPGASDTDSNGQTRAFPKEPDWNEPSYLKNSWVQRDLMTIDIVEGIESSIENAQDDESKAEALYQLASFYFDGNQLLFYNPSAWEGARAHALSTLIFGDQMRSAGEFNLIFEHSRSHDTVARSIPIYLDIVERFPKTRAARDALYTAAVAQEKLSGFNSYWSVIYEQGLFVGKKNVNYTDVKHAYPKYQLPRGTDGWEASTRTVNDGPGWAAAPKPLPRLSRTERAWRKLGGWYDAYSPSVVANVRSVSQTFLDYLTAYLYAILIALIGSSLWANRSAIYHGPIRNGYAVSITALRYLRRLWLTSLAAALPRLSLLYFVKCLNEYVKGHIKRP